MYIKNMPIVRKATAQKQANEKPEEAQMTPAEKLKARKQLEAQKQMELMKQGAKEAQQNYNFASQKKHEQLHAGARAQGNQSNLDHGGESKFIGQPAGLSGTGGSTATSATMELSQSLSSQCGNLSVVDPQISQS